jgi:hypothetical protein
MNSIKVTYLRNLNFRSVFVVFRLMKNIILNKIESFVGKNTSDHACQIFCSKSNCETMYHWFFLLEITVVKIMNNLNVCSAHSYLYPRSRFKTMFMYYYDPPWPLISMSDYDFFFGSKVVESVTWNNSFKIFNFQFGKLYWKTFRSTKQSYISVNRKKNGCGIEWLLQDKYEM